MQLQIFLPDLFEASKASELSSALDQAVLGSLSFNGQRCTALKLFFIPDAHADKFAEMVRGIQKEVFWGVSFAAVAHYRHNNVIAGRTN